MNTVAKHYYFTFSPSEADKTIVHRLTNTLGNFTLQNALKFLSKNKKENCFIVPQKPEIFGWNESYFISLGNYEKEKNIRHPANSEFYLYKYNPDYNKFSDYTYNFPDLCLGKVPVTLEALDENNLWHIIRVREEDNTSLSNFFSLFNPFPKPVKTNISLIDALQFIFNSPSGANTYVIAPTESNRHCFQKHYESHPQKIVLNQTVSSFQTAHHEAFLKFDKEGNLHVAITSVSLNELTLKSDEILAAIDSSYDIEYISLFFLNKDNCKLPVNIYYEWDVQNYFTKTLDMMTRHYNEAIDARKNKEDKGDKKDAD